MFVPDTALRKAFYAWYRITSYNVCYTKLLRTIAEERLNNPRICSGVTRDEFIATMSQLDLEPPQQIHEAWPSNLRCGTPDYNPGNMAGCTL